MTTIKCKICGRAQEIDNYEEEYQKELKNRQMCHQCAHWAMNYELDHDPHNIHKRGDHQWAVINGKHYVFGPSGEKGPFRGFSGAKFKIKFNDGVVKETDNLWHQGNILEAHPHWRELMPDNAEFVKDKGYNWCS